MTLAVFTAWVALMETELATGKITPTYSPIADRLARVLVTFDGRVTGTPLGDLLRHVREYGSFWDLGVAPTVSTCAVTGQRSARLRAVRFDTPLRHGAPPAMVCTVNTACVRATRYYYCWVNFPEVVIGQLWATPARERGPDWTRALWRKFVWLEEALTGLGVHVDQ